MPLLFEYGERARIANSGDLRRFLRGIWELRRDEIQEIEFTHEETDSRFQPFLRFDGDEIRANNYIGFIQNNEELIEIYPKVFRDLENPSTQKFLMLNHIFYWFDYCRKWKFPFTNASLDTREIDVFPELIINLIAKQFHESTSKNPFHRYQPVEESLQVPKGSINFKRYINNGFASGNLHIIDCDHEPFLYDNRVNRIIKYCSRLLMSQTRIAENLRILQDVIFVLDEVEDIPCTVNDVNSVSINAFFEDYRMNMYSCRAILENHLYSSNSNDLSQWCLLFPMEYIFEDFVAGFLHEKLGKEWKVEYQKSDKYLVEEPYKVFMMQHDIFLTAKDGSNRKIIVDTKYKLRDINFRNDRKRGVDQSDLYQMASYALRRGCDEVLLLYPNISSTSCDDIDEFEISSGFDESCEIHVAAAEIPFWSERNPNEIETSLERRLRELLNW